MGITHQRFAPVRAPLHSFLAAPDVAALPEKYFHEGIKTFEYQGRVVSGNFDFAMNFLTWLIIGVLILSALSILGAKQRERELEAMFGGRPPLDDGEFYDRYFAAYAVPRFVVFGVKRIFEKELDVDLSRLQPEDGFATKLNYFWLEDEWAGVDILRRCEEEFGIKLTQSDISRMTTFRNFVEVVWEKIQQKSG